MQLYGFFSKELFQAAVLPGLPCLSLLFSCTDCTAFYLCIYFLLPHLSPQALCSNDLLSQPICCGIYLVLNELMALLRCNSGQEAICSC